MKPRFTPIVSDRYNLRIWWSQHSYKICEKEKDSPKIYLWCGLSKEQVMDHFSSLNNINRHVYLNMQEKNVIFHKSTIENAKGLIFSKMEHFNIALLIGLRYVKFPNRWIDTVGLEWLHVICFLLDTCRKPWNLASRQNQLHRKKWNFEQHARWNSPSYGWL